MLLALFNGRLNYSTMESVCQSTARTVAMIFFIIISATCFAYVPLPGRRRRGRGPDRAAAARPGLRS